MLRRSLLWIIGAVAVLAAGAHVHADSVRERVDAMRPAREAWQTVPWRTDLDAARREAAAMAKPMFIWAMNGNPLGCT